MTKDVSMTDACSAIANHLIEHKVGSSVPVIARATSLTEYQVEQAIDLLVRYDGVNVNGSVLQLRVVRRTRTSEIWGLR